eukprot:TRINITY_DN9219_c1_g1_i1.p1 TRINITY_DN9219_c1_g1~~TRINITY_DN9219_c1_g1_i1.p1  ORF type:complete len:311 (-),score=72.63 TRINITY_DN9219_c1_g1_i1:385-1317(-)
MPSIHAALPPQQPYWLEAEGGATLPWVGTSPSASSSARPSATRLPAQLSPDDHAGRQSKLKTSFFLDCSGASVGLPDGASPDVLCPDGRTCMSLDDECGRIRRAMAIKRQVPKLGHCFFGETSYVRILDGDVFMKCCVSGKPGLEKADCELMWPRPEKPPKQTPIASPLPESIPGKVFWAAKKAAKFAKEKLKALLGMDGCGGDICKPIGDTNPVCLLNAKGKKRCVYQGTSGMLYPEKPSDGFLGLNKHQYKVFQLSAAVLPLRPEDVASLRQDAAAGLPDSDVAESTLRPSTAPQQQQQLVRGVWDFL